MVWGYYVILELVVGPGILHHEPILGIVLLGMMSILYSPNTWGMFPSLNG